jgi:hypothetical protein
MTDESWYVAMVHPKCEDGAEAGLARAGYTVFLPRF